MIITFKVPIVYQKSSLVPLEKKPKDGKDTRKRNSSGVLLKKRVTQNLQLSMNQIIGSMVYAYTALKNKVNKAIGSQLDEFKNLNLSKVHIHYDVYMHKGDLMNVVSILDKILQDILQEEKIIINDNFRITVGVSAKAIESKDNMAKVTIYDLNTEETTEEKLINSIIQDNINEYKNHSYNGD